MIEIILPDGSSKNYEAGITVGEVAHDIGPGLGRDAVGGIYRGQKVDTYYSLNEDGELSIITIDSEEGQDIIRHTASHVLAQAVKRLYSETRLGIGPTTDDGFYYDIDLDTTISQAELEDIRAEMDRIVSEDLPVRREELPRSEAIRLMKKRKEPYKVELISELDDEEVSLYRQGDFIDLCRGPHLPRTGLLKAYTLLSVAGAYWRGDENNPMLQRIYGTAFSKKEDLNSYLKRRAEAKKRDHNILGRKMDLFMTSDVVGQGLPLLKPKGAKVLQILKRFVEDEEERRGYLRTITPFMAKSDLYETSGHWKHYKEDMFVIEDEEDDEMLGLRPMTCPFQFLIYNSELHSYRDLPLRYAETSTLFRNESSGEMHGLIRVRQFTISEGHIICTPEQLESEFREVLDLVNYMMDTLDIREDIWYRFSRRDPEGRGKYIDNPAAWADTEDKMKKILDNLDLDYEIADGEAAFYGPKLDIQFENVHGKEDTIITIQIDFSLPERFDMSYIDSNDEPKRPYVIHRTSIGCYERTLAMLIEKYGGRFPTWLAPTQVEIIPVSEDQLDYARRVKAELVQEGIRTEIDERDEQVGYKIREAQKEQIPYMLIVGSREEEAGTVSIRQREGGEQGTADLKSFITEIKEEIAEKRS